MIAERPLFLFTVLLVGAQGCNLGHHMTFDREAVRQSLPQDVTMDMSVRPSLYREDTVERELIRLGAHVDGNGTLRDSSGKEIRFVHEPRPTGGAWPPTPVLSPADLRKQAEWEKFRKDFTVISITWNQNFEPDPP